MNIIEARQIADLYMDNDDYVVTVVRILSPLLDPIRPNDNGWDVEFIISGKSAFDSILGISQ